MNNQPDNGKNKYNGHGTGKKRKSQNAMSKAKEAMRQLRDMNRGDIPSDTMGSYTGESYDGGRPEQDADDL